MAFGDNAATIEWDFGRTAGATDGEIEDFGGTALIRLDVTAGVTYSLSASTFSWFDSFDDARITVYDAAGNTLQFSGPSSNTAVLAYAAAATGTIYVGIANGTGTASPYDFFVSTSDATNKILDFTDDTYYADTVGERVLGGPGDDYIMLRGATEAFGGQGDDFFSSNVSGARIAGGSGNDEINIVAGDGTAWGGDGVDLVYASSGDDLLFGDDGNDRIICGPGDDTAHGGNDADHVNGGAGSDHLYGDAGGDWILGEDGNDLLDGGSGADIMDGGSGDDTFIVDNAGDVVVEAADGGTLDRIGTSVSYTLDAQAYVEKLSTTWSSGTAAIDLTGNNIGQTIVGNDGQNTIDGKAGADIMEGRGGNDTFVVDNAGDFIIEGNGGGDDWVAAAVSYVLTASAHVEKLSTTWGGGTTAINLTGNNIAQTIIGNDGANTIDGKAGSDIMEGRAGDDIYIVDNSGDTIIETATGGSDWVAATGSWTLTASAFVEKLSTTWGGGTTAINLTGNNIAQTIIGNDGFNVLNGKYGNDRLIGGGGTDYFDFTFNRGGAGNIDIVQGYSVADDTIRLDNAFFTGLANGYLAASAFAIGSHASDALDRIIYDSSTGALYFDDDGSGAHAATQFATISHGLAMTADEFYVI